MGTGQVQSQVLTSSQAPGCFPMNDLGEIEGKGLWVRGHHTGEATLLLAFIHQSPNPRSTALGQTLP